MAAKQTRRSISVKGPTYQRIKNYAAANGSTVAGFVEDTIQASLGPPTDEDRKKFGELVEQREKESEAVKAKEIHEPQIQEAPEPEPEPAFTTEPEYAFVAKTIEAIVQPEPEPKATPEPEPEPKATPEPEPDPGARPPKRRLSKGSPIEPRQEENEDDDEELEDYIPPIQFF
jgi:hypothetical protein